MFKKFAIFGLIIGLSAPAHAQSFLKDAVKNLTNEVVRQGVSQTGTASTSTAKGATSTREEFANVQRALKRQGFEPGVIDGLPGPSSARAIRAYQKSKGYPVTGQLTSQQKSRLLSGGGDATVVIAPLLDGVLNARSSASRTSVGNASIDDQLKTTGAGSAGNNSVSASKERVNRRATDGTTDRATTREQASRNPSQGDQDGDLLNQLRRETSRTQDAASAAAQTSNRSGQTNHNQVGQSRTTNNAPAADESSSSNDASFRALQEAQQKKRQEALCRRDPSRCPN